MSSRNREWAAQVLSNQYSALRPCDKLRANGPYLDDL